MPVAATAEIHKGDIGTAFQITMRDENGAIIDLTSASEKKIRLQRPDLTTTEVNATFATNGADGVIQWKTAVAGDLNQAGTWKIQGVVTLSNGKWHSNIDSFKVYENIEISY